MPMMPFRVFQQKLGCVLKEVKVARNDVVRNLRVLLPKIKWNLDAINNRVRPEPPTALSPDDVEPFVWGFETAPYLAIRAIERDEGLRDTNSVISFSKDTFHQSDIYMLKNHGMTVRYLNEIPATKCFDIFLIELEPNEDSGEFHRCRGRFEIAIGISGTVLMEIHVPGRKKPAKVKLTPGQHAVYDAQLPHRAYELNGERASLYLISIEDHRGK